MQKTRSAQTVFLKRNENKRTPSLIFLQICQYVWQLPWGKIVFTILIFALFLWNKKWKLFTYGEYKLAANNLFKTKKTNFFKRAKLASNTLKENCLKRKKYCILSNLNIVNFFLPYQFWTLFSLTTCSNIIVLDNFCLVYILVEKNKFYSNYFLQTDASVLQA